MTSTATTPAATTPAAVATAWRSAVRSALVGRRIRRLAQVVGRPVATGALLALGALTAACGSESVSGVPAGAVTISPASPTVRIGETVRLTATVKAGEGTDGEARTVFWSSSNPTVATVDGTGLVTPHAVGTAQIAASAGGQSGVAELKVLDMAVSAVRLAVSSTAPVVGDTVRLTVTVLGRGGVVLEGRETTIRSLAPAVMEVVGDRGVARSAGRVSLVAASEGVADTVTVNVKPPPVKVVIVSPPSVTLEVGQTQKLSVETRDRNGGLLTGRTITFSSGSTSIATVTSDGVVKGVRAGSTTIGVRAEAVTENVPVTVTEPPPDPEPPPAPEPPPPAPEPEPEPGPATPASIEIVSGSMQVGPAHHFLPSPVVVRVLDAAGKPVEGVTVKWDANDGGKMEPKESVTDSAGRASTTWKLGKSPGSQSATAAVSGVGMVTFQAVALPSSDESDGGGDG